MDPDQHTVQSDQRVVEDLMKNISDKPRVRMTPLTTNFPRNPQGLCLVPMKKRCRAEKCTVVHCSTFRLFVVNIVIL